MIRHLTSKIAIALYLLICVVLGFLVYRAFKNQDSTPAASQTAKTDANSVTQVESTDPAFGAASSSQTSENTTDTSSDNSSPSDNAATSDDNAPASSSKDVSGSILAHVTTDDCTNDCQPFSNDSDQLEYCQQVCGLSPIKNVTTCDDKAGIQKDYCEKDLAITKEDTSICDSISDASIKQTCKNRILQDAIENQ
jgi:hypothetical protein